MQNDLKEKIAKSTKLLVEKDSFNTRKGTKESQTIFKANLQEKQIPEPATAEDVERFYENSTSK